MSARAAAISRLVDPDARCWDWSVSECLVLDCKVRSRGALLKLGRKALAEELRELVRFRDDSPAARTLIVTFSQDDDRDPFILFAATSTRATVLCEAGRLEHLSRSVVTSADREQLNARGFALSQSGQGMRREVVMKDADSADEVASLALGILFDVFGYRGKSYLHMRRTL